MRNNCYRSYSHDTTNIKITGKWLQDIGFNIGNKFKVYQGKDILLIVKDN